MTDTALSSARSSAQTAADGAAGRQGASTHANLEPLPATNLNPGSTTIGEEGAHQGHAHGPSAASAAARPMAWVRGWLFCIAALVFAMIVVGGATRLTDSGLSITEWKPISGVIPPLNEAQWQAELQKYRESSEYQLQNRGMSMADFQVIFWWEWAHRLLGRFVGLAVVAPLAAFTLMGVVRGALAWRLWGVGALIGVQGAIGWWMVASGLVDRIDVAPYRLMIHLGMAFMILGVVWLTALDLDPRAPRRAAPGRLNGWAIAFTAMLFGQILLGALVAGSDAGFSRNDWPRMNGEWLPGDYLSLSPVWRNFFENVATVQFNHRLGGYAVALAGLALAVVAWRTASRPVVRRLAVGLALATGAQAVLGVVTLIHAVPIALGLLHQAAAAVLLLLALTLSRASGRA